jgi:hypothetical protein
MKSHGCQFCEDGERRPASRIWSRSAAGIDRSAKDRTLRRDSMASQVCMTVPTPGTTYSFSADPLSCGTIIKCDLGDQEPRWLLPLLVPFALHGLFDDLPQPILVGDRQVTPDELHGLAFERVHDGLNLAI